jgi:large subunit ribosomal protein L10
MSRMIKEKMVERYQTRFRDVSDAAVVSVQGVDVLHLTALRGTLRAKGIRALTVQNRICRRALESTPLAAAATLLRGPSTLVWGSDGIVSIAKALTAEAKAVKALQIRGGVSAGQVLSQADMEILSKMPSREELIGMVVGRAMGPASRVAAQVRSAGGRVVAQVREIEKKAPPEPAPAAAEAAAPAAPAGEGAAPPVPEAPAAPAAPSA